MKMNRLFQDILLCKLIEEKTSGLIVGVTDPTPVKAKVLMQGPGKLNKKGRLLPMGTKVGDIVYFPPLNEHRYPSMEEGTVLISESSILGVEE